MFYRIACSSGLGLILTGLVIVNAGDRPKSASADVQGITAVADSPSPSPKAVELERSQANQKELIADLKLARNNVGQLRGYEARFIRQIRKEDELRDPEEIYLKLRHQPFSVYLRWEATGKEALYVDGQNDGKLLVKLDKGLLSFAGMLTMQPDEKKAMNDSRYPITQIGMLHLVDRILQAHEELNLDKITCQRHDESVEGVSCICYTIDFAGPDVHPEFSKTVLHICAESKIPIRIASYGWNEQEPGELVERYEYHDVLPNQNLTDQDFDPANDAYNFE